MGVKEEIEQVTLAFRKKAELENKIRQLIHEYEDETGLKIVGVRFNRLETIRTHSSYYTEICVNIF